MLSSFLSGLYIFRYRTSLFKYFDAFDYAQIARNIAEGHGYTTKLITPLSWSVNPILPHPEFWRPPLYSYITAGGFQLFGTSELVPVLVSVFAYALSGIFVYIITYRLTNARAALLSGIFWLTAPPIFRMGVYPITESTFFLLFLGNLLILTWEKDHPYLLGSLGAFLYLTRFNGLFFIIGILLASARTSEGSLSKFLGKYFEAFLLVLSPWILRNLYYLGNPFYNHQIYQILSGTLKPSGWGIFFYFNLPDPLGYLLTHPGELLGKWFSNVFNTYELLSAIIEQYWLPVIAGVYFMAARTTFSKTKNPLDVRTYNVLLISAVVALLGQVLLLPVFIVNTRIFLPFLGIVAIFAGAGVTLITRRSNVMGYSILSLILIFNIYGLMTLPFPESNIPKNDYRSIAKYVPDEGRILTNKFFFLPWYANRITLAAPLKFSQAKKYYPTFNYVFLHNDPDVIASRKHVNLTRNYTNNLSFQRNFKQLKAFGPNAKLYVRKNHSFFRNQ